MAIRKTIGQDGAVKFIDENGNQVVEPTFMEELTANAPAINAGVGAFNAGLGYMSYLDKKPLFKAQTSLLNQQIASNQKSAADKETFNKNWGTGLASAAASAPRIG